MTVIHFNCGSLGSSFSEGEEGSLIKDALILVEGTHTDNAGVTHTFDKDRIMRNALNTNEAIKAGEIIPFKANHSKDVRDDMGELVSLIECRTITDRDLPNPQQKQLIGKLGAFAKVEIKENLDKVKKKIIRLLSPGIDVIRDRFVEVSAVSRPAMVGPALFGVKGSLSFSDAKATKEEFSKLRAALEEDFSIFCEVVMNILTLDDDAGFEANNQESLLLKAIDEYRDALADELKVEIAEGSTLGESQQQLYNDNPYGDTVVNANPNNQQFSAEEESVITFPVKKRRKRNAS